MRVGVVGRACALSHDGQTPTGKYKVPGPTLLRVVDLYVKEGRGGRALKSQIPCLSPLNMTPVRRVGEAASHSAPQARWRHYFEARSWRTVYWTSAGADNSGSHHCRVERSPG